MNILIKTYLILYNTIQLFGWVYITSTIAIRAIQSSSVPYDGIEEALSKFYFDG